MSESDSSEHSNSPVDNVSKNPFVYIYTCENRYMGVNECMGG